MRLLEHIMISIFLGVIVYALFFFMAGQDGFWAEEQLKQQSMEISLHKTELEKIHNELLSEYEALRYDSDVIASYAKKLDYVGPNEVLLKISGLEPRSFTAYDIGYVKFMQPIIYINEGVCKTAGIIVGCGVWTVLFLLNCIKNKSIEKTYTQDDITNDMEYTYDKMQM